MLCGFWRKHALFLMLFILVFCNRATAETVKDAAGRDVVVPEKVERIAITCYGGTTHDICVMGAEDRIVAQPSMKAFPQLLKFFPRLKEVTDAGSFDNVNIEELMKTSPDIVLVGISSKKGNKMIEDVGLKTYTMWIGWADVDTLKQEFLNIGKLTKNEAVAKKLVSYWDRKLGFIKKMTSKIPSDKKRVVYYTNYDNITKASFTDWIWNWIRAVDGISAVKETPKADLSVEEVMQIDPDVIITRAGYSSGLLSDPKIKDLKAIKNKRVYECPTGAFWWNFPSPEAPLGFMWLAKTVYPEYTKEIDLKKETKGFYKEFYRHDLSDQEYESFFPKK